MATTSKALSAACIAAMCVASSCKKDAGPSGAPSTSTSTSASPSTSTSAFSANGLPDAFDERAKAVVVLLQQAKYGQVHDLFDPAMKKALSDDDAVSSLWESIQKKVGKLVRVSDARESSQQGYHVVLVTCVFESDAMDLRVVFDDQKRVAGLQIVPTTNPNAYGPRPQTPKPPFPYDTREVSFDNTKDHTHLAGTLSVPKGTGKFAVALLITGSGTQDRDETIFGHKPFAVIADALTKKGIAVLRVDDPGAGQSTGDVAKADIEAHARDVEAGVAFLKTQTDVDATRIGLIGHSEGGILAAIVASRSKDVAFVVSLAGTGVSGAEINALQIEAILKAQGKMKPEAIAAVVEAQRKIMKLVAQGAPDAAIADAVKEATDAAMKGAPSEEYKKDVQDSMAENLAMLKTPWFVSFVKLDPASYWSKVKVPVLAMNGDKDVQVPADVNLDAIKASLAKAGDKDVTTTKLPGLNHLFQPAKMGLVEEYATIETTFDEAALATMSAWIAKAAGAKP
jgi:pimeloyl-ACP methyl ester carboxylesterase